MVSSPDGNKFMCGIADVCTALVVTRQYVGQLVEQGVIPKSGKNQFDLVAVTAAYCKWLRNKAPKSTEKLTDAKARRQGIEIERAELELATMKGERVLKSEVDAALAAIHAGVRTAVFAVPSKVTVRMEGKTAAERQAIMIDGLNEACSEIQDGLGTL